MQEYNAWQPPARTTPVRQVHSQTESPPQPSPKRNSSRQNMEKEKEADRSSCAGLGTCLGGLLRIVAEGICGMWELTRTVAAAVRDTLFLDAQYMTRGDSPGSSAVRGKLLVIVVAQTLLLGLELGLLCAVGMSGALADVVHMQFVLAQSAAVASVFLGVYIYVFGGIDPSQRAGEHVYSLYLVVEFATALGGAANFARFASVYDDHQHLAAVISPAHVQATEQWDHGVCGQPHAVGATLLAASALWCVLSGLNVIALLWRNRVKAKNEDPRTSADKPRDTGSTAEVHVQMQDADDECEEDPPQEHIVETQPPASRRRNVPMDRRQPPSTHSKMVVSRPSPQNSFKPSPPPGMSPQPRSDKAALVQFIHDDDTI